MEKIVTVDLVYLIAAVLIFVLWFMLRAARRKLSLYAYLSYNDSPKEVFKAINRLIRASVREIRFDRDVVKMYFDRYFMRVAEQVITQNYHKGREPIVEIGQIFSALSLLISKKERILLENLLMASFSTNLNAEHLAISYFLYLRTQLEHLGTNNSGLEEEGEERIFLQLFRKGKNTTYTEDFLYHLEVQIETLREDSNYSASSRAFVMGKLVQIRATLGDTRTKRLEV